MVLTFYHKPTFMDVRMHRICMVGKKVDELFGSATKQQQYGKPYAKRYMSYLLQNHCKDTLIAGNPLPHKG